MVSLVSLYRESADGTEGIDMKKIDGFDGYFITRGGDVMSIKTGSLKKRAPQKTMHGYLAVGLYDSSVKVHMIKIHRLVAGAFIANPDSKPQVNHLNLIKTDNRVENLEWATAKENMMHSFANGRESSHKGKFGRLNHTSKCVRQLSLSGEFIKEYGSILEAMRETGIVHGNISSVCSGRRETAGGFKWRFL